MPTGYTADVHDGKITTFPEFALTCARAFGALIDMRDAPADAPIPDEFPADTSYVGERIAKARDELDELDAMSEAEGQARADAQRADAIARHVEVEQQNAEVRARYEAMLAEVEAWTPPTPDHVEMKSFMLQQLNESIRFDCTSNYVTIPEPIDGATWIANRKATVTDELERATDSRRRTIQRAQERTAWVAALRSSLTQAVS